MEKWYADFKELDNIKTFNRKEWDDQRDLVIEKFEAKNKEHARAIAFEIAEKHLDRPYMGTLKKLEIEVIKGSKRPNVSGPTLSYLQERANRTVTIEQLAKATGFDEKQIRNAINHAVNRGTDEIETLIRGRAWRWNDIEVISNNSKPIDKQVEAYINQSAPQEVSDDEKGFYMLSTAKDGALILQRDCDGSIWKAVQL